MSKEKGFFELFWEQKGCWQLWLRLLIFPFIVPFSILAYIGIQSERFIDFMDRSLPIQNTKKENKNAT